MADLRLVGSRRGPVSSSVLSLFFEKVFESSTGSVFRVTRGLTRRGFKVFAGVSTLFIFYPLSG